MVLPRILNELAADKGTEGDRLRGYGEHRVFKIRCSTGDLGKSRCVRIIYGKDDLGLGPLSIFAKNTKTDVPRKEIAKRLTRYSEIRSSS